MTKQRVFLIIQAVLCILTAVLLIGADLSIYLEGLAAKALNLMQNIYTPEAVVEKAVFVIPVFIASLVFTILCILLGVKDTKADLPVTGTDIKKNNGEKRLSGRTLVIIRAVVFSAAVMLIVAGIFNGSLNDVLIKAVKICTECIGLG